MGGVQYVYDRARDWKDKVKIRMMQTMSYGDSVAHLGRLVSGAAGDGGVRLAVVPEVDGTPAWALHRIQVQSSPVQSSPVQSSPVRARNHHMSNHGLTCGVATHRMALSESSVFGKRRSKSIVVARDCLWAGLACVVPALPAAGTEALEANGADPPQ
eukprot:1190172-Prorocentrum_minimum.AAC.1